MPSTAKYSLLVIDLVVVVYALAYQLQAPLEPFLVKRLTAASADWKAQYSSLQSFFGLVQAAGALLCGALIDRLGVKTMLFVTFLACAATYALLAAADARISLPLLYASKIPTVFMHGFLCAQTAVSTLTPTGAERVAQLARLTTAYTIGSTIGPTVGGLVGTHVAAPLAIALSFVAACLVLLLPGDATRAAAVDEKDAAALAAGAAAPPAAAAPSLSWAARARYVFLCAWPFVVTKLVTGVTNSTIGNARTATLTDFFKLSSAELGMVMSTISIATAATSLGLGAVTRALGSEAAVVRACLLGAAAVYALQAALFSSAAGAVEGAAGAAAAAPSAELRTAFVGLTVALMLCTYPLSTTLTSLSTGRVAQADKGTLMGIEHSSFAVASMAGPQLGAFALNHVGFHAVAGCAAAVYASTWSAWRASGLARVKEKV
jgi:MFS family permease